MIIRAINPTTEELLQEFNAHTEAEVEAILVQSQQAFMGWRDTAFADRAQLLRAAAEQLRMKRWGYARMMAAEMGKPVTAGLGEIEKCALVCEHYAEHAEGYLADELVDSDAGRSYVACRPLGTVLAVMPWNFPFWQVFRFLAPALMAGNTGLLKHSSNVPHCALAIEDLLAEAGFPDGVFRSLLMDAGRVAELIADPRLAAVTLTGSEAAGRTVAAAAGRALKKTVLELGGSDPFIVLADADLERAAQVGAQSRCINSGQSCIAAKRFIVEESVYEAFLGRFIDAMATLRMGDPLDESTQIGPQARSDLRTALHAQVVASVAAGAQLRLGGRIPAGTGWFYPPTVLTEVAAGMPAYDQELFGPVAAVIRVRDAEGALRVANDTPLGLGGSVWTRDLARGERLAARIEAGAVFVNGLVKSDPRLPFGGVKASGYGRELSWHGIREFVNQQTIWVE